MLTIILWLILVSMGSIYVFLSPSNCIKKQSKLKNIFSFMFFKVIDGLSRFVEYFLDILS